MTSRRNRRRYRKSADRRVWVYSDLNHDLRPEQIAKIITAAGLEQARLEAQSQAEDAVRRKDLIPDPDGSEEVDHA